MLQKQVRVVTEQVRVVTEQVRAVYKNRYSDRYWDIQSDIKVLNTCAIIVFIVHLLQLV